MTYGDVYNPAYDSGAYPAAEYGQYYDYPTVYDTGQEYNYDSGYSNNVTFAPEEYDYGDYY
jgi:hypothetical protein